jgi:hypothetical protein
MKLEQFSRRWQKANRRNPLWLVQMRKNANRSGEINHLKRCGEFEVKDATSLAFLLSSAFRGR